MTNMKIDKIMAKTSKKDPASPTIQSKVKKITLQEEDKIDNIYQPIGNTSPRGEMIKGEAVQSMKRRYKEIKSKTDTNAELVARINEIREAKKG